MKRWVVPFLLLATLSAFAQAAPTRGQGVEAPDGETPIGDQYLFVIAINRYESWPPLAGPVAEATKLRQVLLQRYTFTENRTVMLQDRAATREAIVRQFRWYAQNIQPHDSLLVLYCGHGHLDRYSKRGFWIPSDGGLDDVKQENWLPNAELRGYLDTIPARHILLIADACFAGQLLDISRAKPAEITDEYYRRAYRMKARQVMTSGGIEVVEDASAFGDALYDELLANTDPYIDPAKLFINVRAAVKRQLPLLGNVREAGHQEGGSFLFFLRPEAAKVTAVPPSMPGQWFAMIDGQQTPPLTLTELQQMAQRGEVVATTLVWRAGMGAWQPAGDVAELRDRVKAAPPPVVTPEALPPMEPAGKWPVPPGFRAAAGTVAEPYTDTGWARDIVHEATGIEMVYVPAGRFMMGSPANEIGRFKGETQHRVTLTKGFYLGKYEVTQGQWRMVMGSNPSYFQNAGQRAPVEFVSWDDCQAFCRKLGEGFRLPTEAEWEYACRAGTTTTLYTGPMSIQGAKNSVELDAIAWYGGNSGVTYAGAWDSSSWKEKQYNHRRAGTHPVGQKKPNAWGLYDMIGNVWEWCEDRYGDSLGALAVTDPVGPGWGADRVIRGGNFGTGPDQSRSASRANHTQDAPNGNVGFRLAFVPGTTLPKQQRIRPPVSIGVAPDQDFLIDGRADDWNGIEPVLTDKTGDGAGDDLGSDWGRFYAVTREGALWMRFDMAAAPNAENQYEITVSLNEPGDKSAAPDDWSYRLGVAKGIEPWLFDRRNAQDKAEVKAIIARGVVWAVADCVEICVPLSLIGTPEKASIWPSVRLPGARVPADDPATPTLLSCAPADRKALDLGGVAFVTEPPGVKVLIDGQERGETKASGTSQLSALFEVDGLAAGPHQLSLTRPHCTPLSLSFTVESGKTVRLGPLKLTESWTPTHILKLNNDRVYSGVLLQTDPDGSIVFERGPRVKVTYRKEEVRSIEELKEALP